MGLLVLRDLDPAAKLIQEVNSLERVADREVLEAANEYRCDVLRVAS